MHDLREECSRSSSFIMVIQDKIDIDATAIVDHHALLPHESFHSIFKFAPELFDALFGIGDMLEEWWRQAAEVGGSWYTDHPVVGDNPTHAHGCHMVFMETMPV